jgi:hypothetical protein
MDNVLSYFAYVNFVGIITVNVMCSFDLSFKTVFAVALGYIIFDQQLYLLA